MHYRNTKTQLAKFCTFRCIIVRICIAKYSPQQIQKEQNQYLAALAVSVLGLSFITAQVGKSVAAVAGWISGGISIASLPPNRNIAMPLRFQVTEYRYYLKKPTSTLAGYVDHYVKDLSTGKTYKLKRINIAKNGL